MMQANSSVAHLQPGLQLGDLLLQQRRGCLRALHRARGSGLLRLELRGRLPRADALRHMRRDCLARRPRSTCQKTLPSLRFQQPSDRP